MQPWIESQTRQFVFAYRLAAAGCELSEEGEDAVEIAEGTRELALSLDVEHRKERA